MLSWGLAATPVTWTSLGRSLLLADMSKWSTRLRSLNQHAFSASFVLSEESPSKKLIDSHPYPTTPINTSIFETLSDEYLSNLPFVVAPEIRKHKYIAGVRDTEVASKHPCHPLFRAVQQGRYREAERLRSELIEFGIPIQPDPIYELAARDVIAWPPSEDRVRTFSNWLSLIPRRTVTNDESNPMRRVKEPKHFTYMYHHLFAKLRVGDASDLQLVMAFTIICASKGYARDVAKRSIPWVIRFTEPSVGAKFLDELARVEQEYTESEPKAFQYEMRYRQKLKTWYGQAARVQCIEHRFDAAIDLLQAAQSRKINISNFTYKFVLDQLQQNLRIEDAKIVAKMKLLQEKSSMVVRSESDEKTVIHARSSRLSGLARTLQVLKNLIGSALPPPATVLANFIQAYRSTGRTRGLEMLRKRAYRHSIEATSLWALAEMIYHRNRREPRLVLQVFVRHFSLVGVPEVQVISHLRSHSIAPPDDKRLFSKAYPLTVRIWPTIAHNLQAWIALVQLTRIASEREELYRQLLIRMELAKDQLRQNELPQISSPEEVDHMDTEPLPTPALMLSSMYFTVFIKAFGANALPARAVRVLADMEYLGITPDIRVLSALAGVYAAWGHIAHVVTILDRMEDSSSASDDTNLDGVDTSNSSEPKRDRLPAANLVTYTGVLRGLIDNRHLSGALFIEKRLKERMNYVPGTNPKTDRVLVMLRRLEELEEQGIDLHVPLL